VIEHFYLIALLSPQGHPLSDQGGANGDALYIVETCINRVLHVPILRNGKAVEMWHYGDWLGWLQQFGVIPPLG